MAHRPFSWNQQKWLAVQLIAEDDLTNEQIGERCGVSRQAVDKWKTHPEFAGEVKKAIDAYATRILSQGIARKEKRIAAMNRRWQAIHRVMDERASDSLISAQPGGTTGIIDKQMVPGARTWSYVVDGTLLSEARQLEKQAAQEVGQWLDRTDVTSGGKDAGQILLDLLERPVAITVSEDHNPFNADD